MRNENSWMQACNVPTRATFVSIIIRDSIYLTERVLAAQVEQQ